MRLNGFVKGVSVSSVKKWCKNWVLKYFKVNILEGYGGVRRWN